MARRVYMTKQEVTDKWGEEIAERVQYGETPVNRRNAGEITPMKTKVKKAEIFEVWNKRNKTICFYDKGGEGDPLSDEEDLLEIPGFFPCPKPLAANVVNGNFMPKPDYEMVKSQYLRVEMLTERIFLLEEAVRVAGVYNKDNDELKQLLERGAFNKMIPVDNWAILAEQGGIKGSVDWFPLENVVNALVQLRSELTEANAQLYELTGISDIMRGSTHPRETLGSQQLKAQYSSSRLQYLRNEIGIFIGAVLRIRASIIAKHYQPKSILEQSNIMLTPDAEYAYPAVQLLRDQWSACYRIKVDTDQMAIPDLNAERQGRIEFITATGQFISQIWPMVQAEPGAAPFFLEVLQWGIAGFNSGATIEGVFDQAIKQITKRLQNPPPQKPDPAMVEAQQDAKIEMFKTTQDVKRDNMKTQADIEQGWKEVEAKIAQNNALNAAKIRTQNAKTATERSGD